MTPRTEMQFRTRSQVLRTREGKALGIKFRLGPLHVFVIANLPERESEIETPLAYVKIDLRVPEDWNDHSAEFTVVKR
jgi:hypothetical protein